MQTLGQKKRTDVVLLNPYKQINLFLCSGINCS